MRIPSTIAASSSVNTRKRRIPCWPSGLCSSQPGGWYPTLARMLVGRIGPLEGSRRPLMDGPTRASSSSWRMIAAASRSTRSRWARRWVEVGGPPERPRDIGPSRSSARWLERRSSRNATCQPEMRAISAAQARVERAIVPSTPEASSGRPTTSSTASPVTRRRSAATSSAGSAPRLTVASGRARGPGSSAMATPMRRSPRSIPSVWVTCRSGLARWHSAGRRAAWDEGWVRVPAWPVRPVR